MCSKEECISILQHCKSHLQEEYGVTALAIFGSVARDENRDGSDVDILVEMPPKIYKLNALKEYLESLLKTSVDIIRKHSHMSAKFLTQLSKDAITIF